MHSNIREEVQQHELGAILCKACGELIATIPTEGVKKIYGVCHKEDCKSKS
ncbi:GapA-binding peptide SR1P [Paenibacillus marinisediminis]